ncbi:linear amide C-N hydrolase [Synergistaceae bacterium OttesenSCG-928-I11]|nr:linear amide C-N hydrolase [Synergistaceae bacterium OttesenSCG-928-I11]
MKRTSRGIALAIVTIFLAVTAGPSFACSWAAYTEGSASVVARTMDWYFDDNVVVKGHGRGIAVKANDTPNALEYKSKYASIQFHSFETGIVIEGMNEQGLQCSVLFLDDSELPPLDPERKDVGILNFVSFVVSNFSTVREVTADLAEINVAPASIADIFSQVESSHEYDPQKAPLHFAIADTGGDRAIVEFIDGKTKVYRGAAHDTLTNEPHYDVHLYLDSALYRPDGSNLPADRRARARQMLADMRARKVDESRRALLAMRGVLATVHAGTEQIDFVENDVYPTIWSALADQNGGTYYLWRYDAWNPEYYDFGMFDPTKPEVVTLASPETPPAVFDRKK